jgi:uncharacterized protein (TIGR02246 family)
MKNKTCSRPFVLALMLGLWCTSATAQPDSTKIKILSAINKEVWTAYAEAWASGSLKTFADLYTEDMIRASGGQYPGLQERNEFVIRNRDNFGRSKASKIRMGLEVRFNERIPYDNTCVERGVMHYVALNEKGERFDNYARFHVLLRKVDEKWKIAYHFDSDENLSLGFDDWDAAFAPDNWTVLARRTADDALAIRTLQRQYTEAWLKGDENTILSLFETNARIAPSGFSPVDGIDNIRKFWFPADGARTKVNRFECEPIQVSFNKDVAICTQATLLDWSATFNNTSIARVQAGITTTIYRRQPDGQWKIWQQMWADTNVSDKK